MVSLLLPACQKSSGRPEKNMYGYWFVTLDRNSEQSLDADVKVDSEASEDTILNFYENRYKITRKILMLGFSKDGYATISIGDSTEDNYSIYGNVKGSFQLDTQVAQASGPLKVIKPIKPQTEFCNSSLKNKELSQQELIDIETDSEKIQEISLSASLKENHVDLIINFPDKDDDKGSMQTRRFKLQRVLQDYDTDFRSFKMGQTCPELLDSTDIIELLKF